MTSRMQNYREKKEQQGLVQVRVWVPEEHEHFIKNIAKECRPSTPPKVPERYGRKATSAQISFAESLATIKGKEPPKHLMIITLVYRLGCGRLVVDQSNC